MIPPAAAATLIIIASVGLLAVSGCNRRQSAAASPASAGTPSAAYAWHSDTPYLQAAMPFLGPISSCSWHSETVPPKSRDFVPAPSTQLLSGYAVIPPAQMQSLIAKYRGEPCDVRAIDLEVAPTAPPFAGAVFEDGKLERALPSESTFHSGKVYVLPELNTVYFKLVKN